MICCFRFCHSGLFAMPTFLPALIVIYSASMTNDQLLSSHDCFHALDFQFMHMCAQMCSQASTQKSICEHLGLVLLARFSTLHVCMARENLSNFIKCCIVSGCGCFVGVDLSAVELVAKMNIEIVSQHTRNFTRHNFCRCEIKS